MESIKKSYTSFKVEQAMLKVYIFLSGILLTIYAGLLIIGIRHWIAEIVLVTFAYILLGYGAKMFHLCRLSWVFIIYTYIIRLCIILQPEGVFGEYLDLAHWIAFIVGFILTIQFCIKYYSIIKGYGKQE